MTKRFQHIINNLNKKYLKYFSDDIADFSNFNKGKFKICR
jgi:predicted NAD-dependent protein-ADP-ribosyltransferase YbiA (DUF1768 family)